MAAIRVMLADAHPALRRGVRAFLEATGEIEVVSEAGDGETARLQFQAHQPDVIVLEARLPQRGGIALTRWLRERPRRVGILLFSATDEDALILGALQAGANGYLLKTASKEQVVQAVQSVAADQSVLDPAVAHKLLGLLSSDPALFASIESLTMREREVLALVAEGETNRAIGHTLGISDRTVQGHLANIYGKLQVSSRTEAVTKALQLGLLDLPTSLL